MLRRAAVRADQVRPVAQQRHRRWFDGRGRGPHAADAGMATAEYAIATLAACGFAALLVTILRSGEVQGLLLGIVRNALALGG